MISEFVDVMALEGGYPELAGSSTPTRRCPRRCSTRPGRSTAGPSTPRRETEPSASFYYDFSSPYSYLAAERISGVFSEAGAEQPEWQPISFGHMIQATARPWSMQDGPDPADLEEIQRRTAARGLPEVRLRRGLAA